MTNVRASNFLSFRLMMAAQFQQWIAHYFLVHTKPSSQLKPDANNQKSRRVLTITPWSKMIFYDFRSNFTANNEENLSVPFLYWGVEDHKKAPKSEEFQSYHLFTPPKASLMDTRKSRKWIRLNRIVVGQVGDRSHPPISGKKLGDWGWGIPPIHNSYVRLLSFSILWCVL